MIPFGVFDLTGRIIRVGTVCDEKNLEIQAREGEFVSGFPHVPDADFEWVDPTSKVLLPRKEASVQYKISNDVLTLHSHLPAIACVGVNRIQLTVDNPSVELPEGRHTIRLELNDPQYLDVFLFWDSGAKPVPVVVVQGR